MSEYYFFFLYCSLLFACSLLHFLSLLCSYALCETVAQKTENQKTDTQKIEPKTFFEAYRPKIIKSFHTQNLMLYLLAFLIFQLSLKIFEIFRKNTEIFVFFEIFENFQGNPKNQKMLDHTNLKINKNKNINVFSRFVIETFSYNAPFSLLNKTKTFAFLDKRISTDHGAFLIGSFWENNSTVIRPRVARDRDFWQKPGPGLTGTRETGIGTGTRFFNRDRDRD